MYLDTILRKLKLDEADYTLMGIVLGCYFGSYLKKRGKKPLDDISGGSEIKLAEYDRGSRVRVLDRILRSKAAKAGVVKITLDFL